MLDGAHDVLLIAVDGDVSAAARESDNVVVVVRNCHELGQRGIAEDGIVGKDDVRDVKVDVLHAVIVTRPEGDREAHLPKRHTGSIGHTEERPRRHEVLVGHLHPLEAFHIYDIEASTSIDEGLCDGDVVDGGRTHQGYGAHNFRRLGMVAGIEGDLVLRPLEPLHIGAWLNGSNLVRELLEVAVGERCLSSTEDTSNVPTWLPVAPAVLLGPVVVGLRRRLLLWSICLVRRLLEILLLFVLATATEVNTATFTSTTVAATISTPPGVNMLLMELFEFVAIFGVVGVLLVEYAVWMIILAPLSTALMVVLLLRFRREDGRFLTLVLLGHVLAWRSGGSRFRRVVDE
jgi:hypothetical protein